MTLYLNNSGSRWVTSNPEQMKCILVDEERGYRKVRKLDWWYQFGNFAGVSIRYRGKRIHRLPETFPDEETGLPIIKVNLNFKEE